METSLRLLGAEPVDKLISIRNLASTYVNQGRWEAEELEVQVMETEKRVLGVGYPSTLTQHEQPCFYLERAGLRFRCSWTNGALCTAAGLGLRC